MGFCLLTAGINIILCRLIRLNTVCFSQCCCCSYHAQFKTTQIKLMLTGDHLRSHVLLLQQVNYHTDVQITRGRNHTPVLNMLIHGAGSIVSSSRRKEKQRNYHTDTRLSNDRKHNVTHCENCWLLGHYLRSTILVCNFACLIIPRGKESISSGCLSHR